MKKFLLSSLAAMAVFGLGTVGNPANAQGQVPQSGPELVAECKLISDVFGVPVGECMKSFSAADAACIGIVISNLSLTWPGPDSDVPPPRGGLARILELTGLDELIDLYCGPGLGA
jgi:hypothetical protein